MCHKERISSDITQLCNILYVSLRFTTVLVQHVVLCMMCDGSITILHIVYHVSCVCWCTNIQQAFSNVYFKEN